MPDLSFLAILQSYVYSFSRAPNKVPQSECFITKSMYPLTALEARSLTLRCLQSQQFLWKLRGESFFCLFLLSGGCQAPFLFLVLKMHLPYLCFCLRMIFSTVCLLSVFPNFFLWVRAIGIQLGPNLSQCDFILTWFIV